MSLAIIITAAKLGGYLSYRIGQPAVLGELLVGILLGPSIVDLLHLSFFTDQHLPDVIHELAEIGVLLLMFLAGLDLHLSDSDALQQSGWVGWHAGGHFSAWYWGRGPGCYFRWDSRPPFSLA